MRGGPLSMVPGFETETLPGGAVKVPSRIERPRNTSKLGDSVDMATAETSPDA